MALGSTQPVTEISTRNLPGGKGRPALKDANLTAICESINSCFLNVNCIADVFYKLVKFTTEFIKGNCLISVGL
jgi:hypothetical protein